MGICPKAKDGLRPERCFVRLLNTITEPPRYLISTEEEDVDDRIDKHQWEKISINLLQELLVLLWRVVYKTMSVLFPQSIFSTRDGPQRKNQDILNSKLTEYRSCQMKYA
jgi:hypothetical protein